MHVAAHVPARQRLSLRSWGGSWGKFWGGSWAGLWGKFWGGSWGGLWAVLAGLCTLLAHMPGAAAQPARPGAPPAAKPMRVALAPLETLGAETPASRKSEAVIANALGQVPGVTLVGSRDIRRALDADPKLRACGGDEACLAGLGKAVGATHVVFGEVGGLGSALVVYLELIEVTRGKEVRSTTAELSDGKAADSARAAAFRLLVPERHVGTLVVTVDVPGAYLYIDGRRMNTAPGAPIELGVGTHAVRVTHPEYRDFVRFVDIEFGRQAALPVALQRLPVVANDMAHLQTSTGSGAAGADRQSAPWYHRWYGVTGVSAAVLVTSAVVIGILASSIDADAERTVTLPDMPSPR